MFPVMWRTEGDTPPPDGCSQTLYGDMSHSSFQLYSHIYFISATELICGKILFLKIRIEIVSGPLGGLCEIL